MNLHEQLGALEMGVAQLIQAVVAQQAENIPETPVETGAPQAPADHVASAAAAQTVVAETAAAVVEDNTPVSDEQADQQADEQAAEQPVERPAPQVKPTLEINRPAQDEITMTIGDQMVALRPDQIGKLIEELSNARASMTPEQPPGIPPGWHFVSTKNPVMAVQKQSNGDRLLVMRHTGHGWVPFTFSPDVVIQLYMMLTNA
ncbi:hypothetical protein LMG28614_04572 [Paraburkholderia ultramafica]|uniref:Phage tail protein n=1 Tax=Paraburkholderia ultramafica TaxID=1544867 RepID=A0A6S7BRW0_9BURK|nr:hypothetical protein [Paraburkholderia ultramafica]CAB3797443.1 hypothetical protein LMG28614_04572 [Paraburkholderia ultramafica]